MIDSNVVRYRSVVRFVLEGIEGVAVTVLVLLTWPISKRWLGNWGSRETERERVWPGDALVSARSSTFTRAVDVSAPPSVVWQWLVQFGLGKAGFYSYELLERLLGIPVKNVEQILPEFQSLALGDEIRLHPTAPGIPVGVVAAGSHICFGRLPSDHPSADVPDPNRSWSMYVEPASTGSRLVLRSCVEPLRAPTLPKRLGLAAEEPIDFVMEQRMLRTLKRLAESTAEPRD